ncbi:amidohydrolase family protein [Candidatus Uhrbacteria bacterium]|nr:amidohydrolase family protein [Candidatus Uhrbacteria bacterium]
MIIDAHTHLGRELIEAGPEELLASMKKAGIDRAMVFCGDINGLPTAECIEMLAPHRGVLHAVGSISPTAAPLPPTEKVESWLRDGLIHGLKFYVGYEYFYPNEPTLRPYFALLAKYKKPAVFHSGDTYSKSSAAKLKYALPIHIDDLATEMPELPIVIAHMGFPWVTDAAEVCYKNANVVADCSGFVYGDFDAKHRTHFSELFKEFLRVAASPDKLLFGTDWPVSNQKPYLRLVRKLAGKDAEKILSGNAIRVFGLP